MNYQPTLTQTLTLTPPNGEVIALISALSNPSNHDRHTSALAARDTALSASSESYGNLLRNFARVLATPTIAELPPEVGTVLGTADPTSYLQLQHDPTLWKQFRQMSGLLLKNGLIGPPLLRVSEEMRRVSLPGDAALEIKGILLSCLCDSEYTVRTVTASTIASASGEREVLPMAHWPELHHRLLQCLAEGVNQTEKNDEDAATNTDANSAVHGAEGALDTLRKLCEDAPHKVDHDAMVPALLQYLSSPMERHRRAALQSLHSLLELMPSALIGGMDAYLGGLSRLATDPNFTTRKVVCMTIVTLLSCGTEYLAPHFASICEFMLTATQDPEDTVALEACEFWLAFSALDEEQCSHEMAECLRVLLPRLVPVLLEGMVYGSEKVLELLEENQLDESDANDRAQDVAPIFHKRARDRHTDDYADQQPRSSTPDDEDLDDSDDDSDDEEELNEWNRRKCSAASLDCLAALYGPAEVLPTLLPHLQAGLIHDDLWIREASILALGAIADGCRTDISSHMRQLHPFLLTQLSAELPQLRSIACWTLSRYAPWVAEQTRGDPGNAAVLSRTVTEGFLQLALDANRRVQIAACSALSVHIEQLGPTLVPLLDPIFRNLMRALSIYKSKSLMVLFDTMGVLADYVGPAIGEGTLPTIYVPPILHLWIHHPDPLDRILFPLMESLASVALTLGNNFQPWALASYEHAMRTLELGLVGITAAAHDVNLEEDCDPIVCCADLLDGMVEGLRGNFVTLLQSSSTHPPPKFLTLLHTLLSASTPAIRMSAFALLGDLANRCPVVLEPALPTFLREAIHCVNPLYPTVCNNAVWSVGEICVKFRGGNLEVLTPFVSEILERIVPLIVGTAEGIDGDSEDDESLDDEEYDEPKKRSRKRSIVPGLVENASATLGRLARIDPAFIKDDLPRFLSGWCEGLARISDLNERRDAFEGLVMAIQSNPHSILSLPPQQRATTVTALIFAVTSWHIPDASKFVTSELLYGDYAFAPFPVKEVGEGGSELWRQLGLLLRELKRAIGEGWDEMTKMPVNVKRLLAEMYQV